MKPSSKHYKHYDLKSQLEIIQVNLILVENRVRPPQNFSEALCRRPIRVAPGSRPKFTLDGDEEEPEHTGGFDTFTT